MRLGRLDWIIRIVALLPWNKAAEGVDEAIGNGDSRPSAQKIQKAHTLLGGRAKTPL